MTSKNETLAAALSYEKMGFSVIPVGRDKRPLLPWKKHQEQRANPELINQWFTQNPTAGIGIVTGAISGIVVVDIEKDGEYEYLPPSVCSKTGGGGVHLYYAYDPKQPVKNYTRIRELTDIRGDGGYVVAPPSGHKSGGQYSWIAHPSKNELQPFPYFLLEDKEKVADVIKNTENSNLIVNQVVNKGHRNDQAAKIAGQILHKIEPSLWELAGWPALKEWNTQKCQPPLGDHELRKVWESIKKAQKTSSNKKGKESKKEVIEVYSKVFKDGTIVETYFDEANEETGFLVCQKGEVSKKPYLTIGGKVYSPPPPSNGMVGKKYVKLPSDFTPFVSEKQLLQDIGNFIHEYVELQPEFEEITSFYILFSWVYDAFHELPYLRVLGDYGTGKSRMIKVVGALGYKSIFLNGATSTSAIFRMINEVKGMIVLDEGDFRYSDTNHELVKILNSGFQKDVPVFRSEAKGSGNHKTFDPTPFDVFCPKVLATRRNFQDEALESRCLTYAMQTAKREDIPENLDDTFYQKALTIRNKLVSFRFKRLSEGIEHRALPKLSIEPRLKQIIKPLYSIIKEAEARDQILNFIQKKQVDTYESRFNSQEGQLLQAVLMALKEEREPSMKAIAQKYNDNFAGNYPIKARKAGEIVGQILNLEKKSNYKGIHLCDSKKNIKQIEELKIKFGFEKPNLNIMNVMNIEQRGIDQVLQDAEEVFGVKSRPINQKLF